MHSQDANANKRHAPITFQSDAAAKRQRIGGKNTTPTSSSEQRLYKAPSGKFSGKVNNNRPRHSNNRNGNSFRQRNNQGNRNFRKY